MSAGNVFWQRADRQYPTVVRAEGAYIYTDDGRRFLDGSGGAMVASIGHGVREVIEATYSQARQSTYVHGGHFSNPAAVELGERLAALAPGDLNHVFLVSGGSEATESAAKLARQYHVERGEGTRYKIISRWASYHGATLGALSMTGHVARRRIYEPLLGPFPHIPPSYCYRCPFGLTYPDCEIRCATVLEDAIQQSGEENIAAFIAEPVVGAAAAAIVPPPEYFPLIREICDRYGVLLIADEVVTGMGRTGRNFAVEHWDVLPDMITVAKGISGGYAPLGAVIAREPIVQAIAEGSAIFAQGFTFDGHPASAAAGAAVLRYVVEQDLVAESARKGPLLMEKLAPLQESPIVGDIRGLGMLVGLEFVRDRVSKEPFPSEVNLAGRVTQEAFERGLIVYACRGMADGVRGDAVLLAPPLNINEEDMDAIAEMLTEAVASVAEEVGRTS